MKSSIQSVDATEILDSRGNPTIQVEVALDTGPRAWASVPSGASTGENEAVELRDDDMKRYGGKGVLRAIENIRSEIAPALIGKSASDHVEIDRILVELDGTPNKSRLGANAILGASMAVVRAAAEENLLSHGRLATSQLGRRALESAASGAVLAASCGVIGAMVPLLICAYTPGPRWIGLGAILLLLAALGGLLARSFHGSVVFWSVSIAVAGAVLGYVGLQINIVG
jgi:hypothetical protein